MLMHFYYDNGAERCRIAVALQVEDALSGGKHDSEADVRMWAEGMWALSQCCAVPI